MRNATFTHSLASAKGSGSPALMWRLLVTLLWRLVVPGHLLRRLLRRNRRSARLRTGALAALDPPADHGSDSARDEQEADKDNEKSELHDTITGGQPIRRAAGREHVADIERSGAHEYWPHRQRCGQRTRVRLEDERQSPALRHQHSGQERTHQQPGQRQKQDDQQIAPDASTHDDHRTRRRFNSQVPLSCAALMTLIPASASAANAMIAATIPRATSPVVMATTMAPM